jgi:acetyltransferase
LSARNLHTLLNPASVAVVGASVRPDSVGATLWRNLRAGSYRGPVYAVNPRHRRLDGQSVYPSVDDLPAAPELALVCTPAAAVPQIVQALGRRGTRAVALLSDGLDAAQRQAVVDTARQQQISLLGPGSVGLLSPQIGLNASIAHSDAAAGELAFVSQSGSLVSAVLDYARARSIGFSHVVALGRRGLVDAAELLDVLGSDAQTRSILLYIETIDAPRRFLSAARAAARNKPVIVVRSGRAADAAADRVYDAAIARAGMLRVRTLQQLFLAAETLARFRGNRSEELAILGNGRGATAMAADAADRAGIALCTLQPATLQALQPLLQTSPAPHTPLLLHSDAAPQDYVQALQHLSEDPAQPALLVVHAPRAQVQSAQVARAMLPLARTTPPRVMGCWLGGSAVAEARRVFQQTGVAGYATPEEAVGAFSMLVDYRHNQAQLIEAPPSSSDEVPVDAERARALVQRALGAGQHLLEGEDARELLDLYGIAVQAQRAVEPEPYAAASAAEKTGYPVALRLRVPEPARSEGGAERRLDLRSAVQVRDAARRMLAELQRGWPELAAEGFDVESMARPAHARTLHVAVRIDPSFGPVILLGHGESAEAADGDAAVALPPLNAPLARALIDRSDAAVALRGQGELPPADLQALQRLLVRLSQLLIDVTQIEAVDLSPLLAGSDGVRAQRARVRLSLAAPSGALNFAIRPYPSQLVETLDWRGRRLTLRPIRPEDEARHIDFLSRMEPADIRMRVFYSRRSIERSELARLTQIDYAREMAFVALDTGPDGQERTIGVVRAITDADNASAEFGLMVRSDLKGEGLGPLLMQRIIDYQREHGTQRLVATVLAENTRMLELARRLGFVEKPSEHGDGTRYIELAL